MSTSPRPPHHTRLALLSLLISALTLALSVFIALVLLPAALSIPPLFLGARPSATFVRLNLLAATDDDVRETPMLKPRLATPTAVQAGWTLVTASGSLVGCIASLGLLVARCQRRRRMARLGLAFFCVVLGAAWGGALMTGITQLLLLFIPRDRLISGCKAIIGPAGSAVEAAKCSKRLWVLMGVYAGLLVAVGLLAGALLECERRICRRLQRMGGRDAESVVLKKESGDGTGQRAVKFVDAPRSVTLEMTALPKPMLRIDCQQLVSPRRHPTILRPGSIRSASTPTMSPGSSFSSPGTLIWSGPAHSTRPSFSSFAATPSTTSTSTLRKKSPALYSAAPTVY